MGKEYVMSSSQIVRQIFANSGAGLDSVSLRRTSLRINTEFPDTPFNLHHDNRCGADQSKLLSQFVWARLSLYAP